MIHQPSMAHTEKCQPLPAPVARPHRPAALILDIEPMLMPSEKTSDLPSSCVCVKDGLCYTPPPSPMRSLILRKAKKSRQLILVALATVLLCLFALASFVSNHPGLVARWSVALASLRRQTIFCTPDFYDRGNWKLKDVPPKRFITGEDVLEYIGSPGRSCPFVDEAIAGYGIPTIGIHRLTQLMSYEWETQCSLVSLAPLEQLQWLIDNGGWLFVGDSTSRQQFALLGCQLGNSLRHVVTGDDLHSATHDFYLNDISHLYAHLSFPHHFNPRTTPLVTFQRSDLLFSRRELLEQYANTWPGQNLTFGTEPIPNKLYDIESKRYLDLLDDPLRRYSTIVASTGAHWTLKTLNSSSYVELLDEFEVGMRKWMDLITERLSYQQKLIIRAATPGHGNCAEHVAPLRHRQPVADFYNWRYIPTMNDVMRTIVRDKASPLVAWLGGERPARLRPDAHNGDDCLHLNIGSGVVEGWTQMVWQAVLLGGAFR